jgi:hypothetical protein
LKIYARRSGQLSHLVYERIDPELVESIYATSDGAIVSNKIVIIIIIIGLWASQEGLNPLSMMNIPHNTRDTFVSTCAS